MKGEGSIMAEQYNRLLADLWDMLNEYPPVIAASVLCRVVADFTIIQDSPKTAYDEFVAVLGEQCKDAILEEASCK